MTNSGTAQWLQATLQEALAGSALESGNVVHAGIFDADGHALLLTDAAFGASMSGALQRARQRLGESWKDGDVALSNDADAGAVNACEMLAITPVIQDVRSVAFVVLKGYVPDFGGWEPAGFSPQAVDRWAEGARIELVTLRRAGGMRREVMDILRLNSRTPNRTVANVTALTDAALRLAGSYLQAPAEIAAGAAALRESEARTISQAVGHKAAAPLQGSCPIEIPWGGSGLGRVQVRLAPQDGGLDVQLQGPGISPLPINLGCYAAQDITLAAICHALELANLATGALMDAVSFPAAPEGMLQASLPHAVGLGRHITGRALFTAVFGALNDNPEQLERAWDSYLKAVHPFAPAAESGKLGDACRSEILNLESKETMQ